jgi:hypothetical protein
MKNIRRKQPATRANAKDVRFLMDFMSAGKIHPAVERWPGVPRARKGEREILTLIADRV